MQTHASQTILVTPMLSPRPPMPPEPYRFLDREDSMVFVQVEPVEDEKPSFRIPCGRFGAGETRQNVPPEFRGVYDRWTIIADAEFEDDQEALDNYDADRAHWHHDFDSTRGL